MQVHLDVNMSQDAHAAAAQESDGKTCADETSVCIA